MSDVGSSFFYFPNMGNSLRSNTKACFSNEPYINSWWDYRGILVLFLLFGLVSVGDIVPQWAKKGKLNKESLLEV